MGFKRTSEGRVFFQNSNDDKRRNSAQDKNAPQSQLEILTLLKALNERLKNSQLERRKMHKQLETYRYLIEDLAGKTEASEEKFEKTHGRAARAEKLASEMARELETTRKVLLGMEKKTADSDGQYARLQKRLEEAENKQADVSNKIEETLAVHERLVRKVDQAVEDRARFMRKMERIEETVIQTRDALNAKAMVLLTDQGAKAGAVPLEDMPTPGAHDIPGRQGAEAHTPFWRKPFEIRASGAVFLLVIVVVVAALIYEAQKPDMPNLNPWNDARLQSPGSAEPDKETAAVSLSGQRAEPGQFTEQSMDDFVPPAPRASQETSFRETGAGSAVQGLSDQEALALFESDPDQLAGRLNQIEPGRAGEASAPAPPVTQTKQAHLGAQPQQEVPGPESLPEEEQATLSDVGAAAPPEFLKADPALPEILRDVETNAFEGVPEAQHDLAAIYTAGHGGAPQDYARAVYWFRQAAAQDVANAQYNLGVLHHQGLGVEQNIDTALEWYRQAAALDHPEAQYNLGIAYIEGVGVAYDPAVAAGYFEQAAEAGVMEAAYNLGLIHENGLLGEAKPDEALMWYKTAADQGSPEARAALEQLARTLDIGLEEVNSVVENMVAVKTVPTAGIAGDAQATPVSADKTAEETGSAAQRQNKSQALLVEIQEELMTLGLYPGPANGIDGPLIADAIRVYQARHGFEVTGQPSQDLLTYMQKNGLAGQDKEDLGSREE